MKEVAFNASLKTSKIVGGRPLINPLVKSTRVFTQEEQGWEASPHAFWLPTIPGESVPCENYFARNIDDTLATCPPFKNFSWHVHVGDWWGDVGSHEEVPLPYEVITPVRFGPHELLALPGRGWRFIYMVRDGRNQIESLRNIPGGIESEKHQKNPQDYFQVLCKGFRNRARLALDCQTKVPGFKMYRFENFIQDPLKTMNDIYEFLGLGLDRDFVTKAWNLTLEAGVQKQHSSFKTSNFDNRWHSWSDWEKETFDRLAGKELEELGYKR